MTTTSINTELQTRLEISINAHTSYSNKFKFEFRPFMINSGSASSSSSRSINDGYGGYGGYGSSSSSSGTKSRMVFLPITHLVDEMFPKFYKRYKKQGMLIFTNSEEYLQYIKFANGVLYEEEESFIKKNKSTPGAAPELKSKYVLDGDKYVEMINRNIKFILKELFIKNRILINVLDNDTRIRDRINKEYYIESFSMPGKMQDLSQTSQQNDKTKTKNGIFKDSSDEIQKITNERRAIDVEIKVLERSLSFASADRRKIEFQIKQKKLRREKKIQQLFTYTYGEMDNALNEKLKYAESYNSELASRESQESRESSSSSSSLSALQSSRYYYNPNLKQDLAKVNAWLESRKVHVYIVTIDDMSLISSLLDNGKDNPQFTLLRNKMAEGDIFDGRIKSQSIFELPSRAQCASDKRIIERMYDEIFNAKRLLRKDQQPEEPHSVYNPTNYLEKFKKLFDGIGANKSSDYFGKDETKKMFDQLVPTYEGSRKVAGGDEDPIVILCKTKMGVFLLFFTLFESETLKLHRPNISSLDNVHIRKLPMKTGTGMAGGGGGGDKFEVTLPIDVDVKNLDLILNTSVPPSYFTSNADYGAYNAYKTHDSVYKRFDFFALGAMNNDSMESRNYAAAVKVIGVIIKDIAIMRDALINIKLTSPKPITDFFTKIQDLVRALSSLSKVSTDKGKMAIIKVMLTRAKGIEKLISSANGAAIEFFNATELSQNKKSSAIAEYDNARMAFITKHNTIIRDTAIADAIKIRDDAMIVATTNYESAKTAATQKKAANDAAYGIATDKADKAYETAINIATTTFNSTKNNVVYTAAKTAAEQTYTLAITAAKTTAAKTSATADFTTEMTAADKTRTTAIDDATTVYTKAKTSAEQTYIKESEKASAINAKDDKVVKDNEFTTVIDNIKKQHIDAKTAADKAVANYKYTGSSIKKDNATKNKNRADAIVKEDEAATKTLVKLAEAADVDYSKPVKLFGIGPMQTSMDDKLAKKLGSVQTAFNNIFYFNDVGIQRYNAAKQNSERLKNAQVELNAAEKAKADINLEFFTEQFYLDKTHYDEAVNEYTTVTGAFITKHKDKNRTAFLAYEDALRLADTEYATAAAAAAKKPAKDTPFHVKTIIDEAVTTPPTLPTKVEYSIPAIETAYMIAKDSAFETFATAVKAKGPINEIKPDLAAIADAKKIRDEKKAINEISKRALEVPFIEDANAQVQVKINDLTKQIGVITNEISTAQAQMNADELQTKYAFKLIETDFKKISENPDTASATPTAAATPTSKKPESKFDDLEFLKGIIDHVEDEESEDEENAETVVDKVKMNTSSKLPVRVKPVKIDMKKEPTSDEQGKQLAAEMGKRGIKVETDSYRGLQNQGQTCYMNAALQLIFSMTKVKDEIIATNTGGSDKSTFHYLKQYMEKMNGGKDIQPANELFDSVKGDTHFQGRNFGNQEDSEELLIRIFDTINSDSADVVKKIVDPLKFKKIVLTVANGIESSVINKCREHNIISDTVQKKLYDTLNNKNILFGIPETTDSTTIRMNISKSDSTIKFKEIYDLYISERAIYGKSVNMNNEIIYPYCRYSSTTDAYPECKPIFSVETMTAEELRHEPTYSHKFKNVKNQDIIQFHKNQKYFIIQLMRFGDNTKKITTSIDIENSEIPANDGTPDVFQILGCICHSGTLFGGHYTYASFKDGKPDKYYNDSAVSDLGSDNGTKDRLKTLCYVLLFERVTTKKAKAGGGSNQANQTIAAKETRRCQLVAANRPSPNKYTRRHNKNKNRAVTTVTVIKR